MTTHEDHHSEHLAERVFGRIERENVIPRSRWEFIVKNYIFWTLGVLAVILGALAFSATIFEITNVDWSLSVATHPSFFSFFLEAAPFIWILILAIFIIVGYFNVRQTNHGYRYSLAIIALGAVLTSLSLGSGLYAAGFGRTIDEMIGDHPPFYRPIIFAERSWWLAPEKGLLGGEILQVATDIDSFTLRDFSGRVWKIYTSDLHKPDLEAIARGGIVRIVGLSSLPVQKDQIELTVSTTTEFHACFVFPWEIRGIQNKPRPPLAAVASTSERSASKKGDACKKIRPYQQLHLIDEADL